MESAIDEVLRTAVQNGSVPNVAAIAADRNGVFYEGAAGPRTVGESQPVAVDTTFRLASMTKMIATTVALQMVESGELDLDAPVAKYCPEFGDLKVIDGFDGDTPKLRPPTTEATVKHLVTHTSGLAYWAWSDAISKWENVTGNQNVVAGLNTIFTEPLTFDPGARFCYGINIDWLGKVCEAVAGRTLDTLVEEGVTDPLGMHDTRFLIDDAQRATSTPVHVQGEDGQWVSLGEILNQQPDWFAGGHGLYSTPRDYIRFEQALLRGGELDGTRILSEDTVDAAFANQIGELDFPPEMPTVDPAASCDVNLGPGLKWGYGLLLNTYEIPGFRRAGSGSWAGLCNTHFWIDPTSGICASIYSNFLPFATPASLQLYADFEQAVYATRG